MRSINSSLNTNFLTGIALSILAIGYAFFGRGFAHLGFHPIYIGEIIMFFMIFLIFLKIRKMDIGFINKYTAILGLFLLICLLNLIPYLGEYHVIALRDSMIWLYSVFAYFTYLYFVRRGSDVRFLDYFGKTAMIYVAWLALLAVTRLDVISPTYPWSDVRILHVKKGDMGVLLAGVGIFQFLKLSTSNTQFKIYHWIFWFAGFLYVGTINRGGLITVVLAFTIVFLFKLKSKKTLIAVLVALISFPALYVSSSEFSYRINSLLTMTTGNIETAERAGTVLWRLAWWEELIEDELSSSDPFRGKGFGVSLATNIQQISIEEDVRSPHNGHITILARVGLIGFILWSLFQLSLLYALAANYFKYKHQNTYYSNQSLWLFTFLSAFLINTNFDVYLEGPQGGILYWMLIGYIIYILNKKQILMNTLYKYKKNKHTYK